MSIEEKKKPLEFTYVPDAQVTGDTHLLAIDVVYHEDPVTNRAGLLPITLTSKSGQTINCDVEFFQEVISFLTKKGVIQPQILSRTANSPGPLLPTVNAGSLQRETDGVPGVPLPKIDYATKPDPSHDALSSFDITSEASQVKVAEAAVGDVIKATELPKGPVIGIAPGNGEVEATPAINRPVIRSRVTGDDPQSAEKEAAMIRDATGKTKSNFRRTD